MFEFTSNEVIIALAGMGAGVIFMEIIGTIRSWGNHLFQGIGKRIGGK